MTKKSIAITSLVLLLAGIAQARIAGLIGMDVLGQNWRIIDCGNEKLYFAGVR